MLILRQSQDYGPKSLRTLSLKIVQDYGPILPYTLIIFLTVS